ncbi:CoA ester lyase [Aquincola sp. MAHUQ-54]|uniref:CoA ester lyase n=1 Tax=Aquincola agrisoli TaxID=3119538 RepID=A0AAW9QAK0_9BURK
MADFAPGQRRLPAWRSILYVPANAPRFIASAPSRGADAIQLDLEDSVPPAEKPAAREGLRQAVAAVAQGGADVLVRINRPLSLAVADVQAAVCAPVKALTVTKVDGPSHVRLLDELVSECEAREALPHGQVGLVLLIETVAAFMEMREIASASPRVIALALGSEDFALDAGMAASDDTMLGPKQRMVLAARAAGVLPLGYIGSVVDLEDPEGFRAMVRRSRGFGFEAATCVHPRQVAIVNEEYGVPPAELAWARRVVDEHARHAAAGQGAFRLDGRMVDKPVVDRAVRLLARDAALRRGGAASGS